MPCHWLTLACAFASAQAQQATSAHVRPRFIRDEVQTVVLNNCTGSATVGFREEYVSIDCDSYDLETALESLSSVVDVEVSDLGALTYSVTFLSHDGWNSIALQTGDLPLVSGTVFASVTESVAGRAAYWVDVSPTVFDDLATTTIDEEHPIYFTEGGLSQGTSQSTSYFQIESRDRFSNRIYEQWITEAQVINCTTGDFFALTYDDLTTDNVTCLGDNNEALAQIGDAIESALPLGDVKVTLVESETDWTTYQVSLDSFVGNADAMGVTGAATVTASWTATRMAWRRSP